MFPLNNMEHIQDAGEILPESPGHAAVLNPFESPNDYHSLHESVVASPSLFRSSRTSSATPAKFKWSIDEIASLLPVDIDPEDIHRQSLYLSQTRTDKEIEERRQHAIEQFFTKNTIVPSPWAEPESKQPTQLHALKCSISPKIPRENLPNGKANASSQTVLSLPVDFDLEKILGEYFRADDADQSGESVSSPTLRRKLFLDGHECESVSPQASPAHSPAALETPGVPSSYHLSPLRGPAPLQTPSSGQFSSSPIKGSLRCYSLESVTSPVFSERPSLNLKTPTLSPIFLQPAQTPVSERKRLNFLSPDGVAVCSSNTKPSRCAESPYVEGCSPIKSCSPVSSGGRLRMPRRRVSTFQLPLAHECTIEEKETLPLPDPMPPMDMDACSLHSHSVGRPEPLSEASESLHVESAKGNNTVNMGEPVESAEDESAWVKDGVENVHIQLTSSRTGSTSNAEGSHMFLSLLAESSGIPCDSASIQVDSAYNTQSIGVSNIADGTGTDIQQKDMLDVHLPEESCLYNRMHFKSKFLNLHH
ncbi:protein aurora borealis isoform X2 [Lepisosteus oculatus]|uniref:protein aurora borealis isoform X2 n=1 Tax=Lepisosteus oculatus TaxID=7918 RepID=UPI0007400412|nr:PREDICTED: protein aurora borealis isoform X2 [Lepisosteus oculatus]